MFRQPFFRESVADCDPGFGNRQKTGLLFVPCCWAAQAHACFDAGHESLRRCAVTHKTGQDVVFGVLVGEKVRRFHCRKRDARCKNG